MWVWAGTFCSQQGKPQLVDGGARSMAPQFNLSHGGDLVLLALHPSQAVGAPVSCLFSSHNLGQVKRLATRVLYLERGRVLVDLPVRDFFDAQRLPALCPSAFLFVKGELS
jgi:hypothetical protein